MFARHVPSPVFTALLGVTATAMGTGTALAQTVDPNDRGAVAAFYTGIYQPAFANGNHGWTGSTTTCTPGTLNSQFVADTRTVVNVFRALAGLSNITFGDPRNFATRSSTNPVADCQQGALMLAAAGTLSHNLPASGPCGSALGSAALLTSNLALGGMGGAAITQLMRDQNTPSLGHRRYILDQSQQQMAFGSTGNYTVLNVLAPRSNAAYSNPSAWPPAGYVPYQMVFPTWSFAVPGQNQVPWNSGSGADFSNATVSVTQGGNPVPITTYLPASCIACYDHAIAWSFVNAPSFGQGMPDTTYQVTIQNVGNTAPGSYSYMVTVFDPAGGPPIANDECPNATTITDGSNGPFHNNGASTSQPAWPCGQGANDVWFTYTATRTGPAVFATCTPTRDFDTVLQVFAGTCGSLQSLGCNDDFCSTGSSVTASVVQGQSYRVRVGGYGGDRGTFALVVSPYGSTGSFQTFAHGCGSATLTYSGSGGIGATTTFELGGTTGVPVIFFGFGRLDDANFCPPCTVGPNPEVTVVGSSFALRVPNNTAYIGAPLHFQGADFLGTSGCSAPQVGFTSTVRWVVGQ